MKQKVIIAAGGSGGHIYPALAIAEKLKQLDPDIEVHFAGTPGGLENKLIPRENFPLHTIPVGRLNRNARLSERLFTILMLPWAMVKSFLLVLKLRPTFVLGVGGFATGPIILAASLLRVRSYIWEPNAYPGLANRLLSRFVTEGLLLFKESLQNMSLKKYQLVGYPVRSSMEVIHKRNNDVNFHVLVFGGSQGARGINNALIDALEQDQGWLEGVQILHQTGSTDYKKIIPIYERISHPNLSVREYIHDMPEQYAWADLVICRSGAGTLAELAACGKTGLLIPLPWAADDHQKKNAEVLVKAGAAFMIEQSQLTGQKLRDEIIRFKQNRAIIEKMQQSIHQFYRKEAALEISEILLGSKGDD